jgi:PAS domain S-box-containing protein
MPESHDDPRRDAEGGAHGAAPRAAQPDAHHQAPPDAPSAGLTRDELRPPASQDRHRSTDEQYHLLVERVRDYAIFLLDSEGYITDWGEGARRMKGYTTEEAIGRHLSTLYPDGGSDDGTADEHLRRAAAAGEYTGEGRRVRKGGEQFWAQETVTALRREGVLYGFSKVTRDLTAQKRAEDQLNARARQQAAVADLGQRALAGAELPVLMDAAAAAVCRTLDVEHCSLFELLADSGTLRLAAGVGWRDGLVGTATMSAQAGDSQAGYALQASEPVIVADPRSETRFGVPALLRDHGVVSGVSVVIHGSRGPYGVLGAHTGRLRGFTRDDVHFLQSVANVLATAIERRRYEEALGSAKRSAEEARSRAEDARRAADEANAAKSQFLATMSHEIRTPINAVLGYTELLEMDLAGPVTDQQRGYLERIQASGRHLLNIVDDVLDLAKVEAGRLSVARTRADAHVSVSAALSLIRPQAAARGIAVSLRCRGDTASPYLGDEDRVRQILVNLLSNAVKFTEPGGRIEVTCERVDRPDGDLQGAAARPEEGAPGGGTGWTCIRVADTGIGIAPEKLASVFEPFVQVEGALQTAYTRQQGGTGLGLAISRRLARLMGGDLTARSELDAGSTFTLWLPTAPSDATPVRSTGVPAGGRAQGLGSLGAALGASASVVVRAVAERMRRDPAIPSARDHTQSELEDHLPTFLTDLGQALVVLDEDGGETSAIFRDGSELQRLLSERHGATRYRMGWTEAALAREYEILGEEVDAAVRRPGTSAPDGVVDDALRVLRLLLARAAELARAGFRGAVAGEWTRSSGGG